MAVSEVISQRFNDFLRAADEFDAKRKELEVVTSELSSVQQRYETVSGEVNVARDNVRLAYNTFTREVAPLVPSG